MSIKEENVVQLEIIASALGDLLQEVVFVGGNTTALLVDEAAHYCLRKTDDVDVIIDVTTYLGYQKFSERLKKLNFREDVDGPTCRWLIESHLGTVKLDVMPIDEEALGFSNRWYKEAIDTATQIRLPSGILIRVVSPAYFLATKFEAFADRGKGDYFSHDMEDIIFVLENRRELILELMDCTEELKAYFSEKATGLMNDKFLNVLPGLLNSTASEQMIINNLNIMKGWAS